MAGTHGTSFALTGKLALVTGGSTGLGYAIAQGLASAGARIIINGRDVAKLDRAADSLAREGASIEVSAFDVTDGEAVAAAIEGIEAAHGTPDILVNNAGVNRRQPLERFSDDEWNAVLGANIDGPFHVTRAVLPGMKARRRGKILNICSMAGEIGRPNIVPYATSKGALKMFTRALAVEVARFDIQVNGIAPGFFTTEMNAALVSDPEFDQWVRGRTPAGRWGDPADISGAAVFLVSSAASYITGHILFVDGGFTASY